MIVLVTMLHVTRPTALAARDRRQPLVDETGCVERLVAASGCFFSDAAGQGHQKGGLPDAPNPALRLFGYYTCRPELRFSREPVPRSKVGWRIVPAA